MDTETIQNETSAKIAKLNDAYRRGISFTITQGVQELHDVLGLIQAVRGYNDFNHDNDPYEEHDFGVLYWYEEKIFWKIDYYDEFRQKWCDPLDPACNRVLTIMLAEEY